MILVRLPSKDLYIRTRMFPIIRYLINSKGEYHSENGAQKHVPNSVRRSFSKELHLSRIFSSMPSIRQKNLKSSNILFVTK